MKVRDFMSAQVITALPTTKITEVWHLIFRKHIHGLPIVDKSQKLIGIISEEDILQKLYPDYGEVLSGLTNESDEDLEEKLDKVKHLTAEKLMNRRVIFTHADANVMRALSRMIVRNVRQLPVVDDDDRVIGVITKGDIFDNLFKLGRSRRRGSR